MLSPPSSPRLTPPTLFSSPAAFPGKDASRIVTRAAVRAPWSPTFVHTLARVPPRTPELPVLPPGTSYVQA